MKMMLKTTVSLSALLLTAGAAFADCGIAKGSVRILSNDFEALRVIETATQDCVADGVTVTANATAEHKNLQVPALTINPAEYTVAMVANNSIVPLLNDDLIRPLDDLVAKYGQDLQPNQLIKIDGKVMAIAFMGNSQHLFYRKDILEKAGITAAPTSYEDVLAAAKANLNGGKMYAIESKIRALAVGGNQVCFAAIPIYSKNGPLSNPMASKAPIGIGDWRPAPSVVMD